MSKGDVAVATHRQADGILFLDYEVQPSLRLLLQQQRAAAMQEQTLPLHIAKSGLDYFFSTNPSRHIRFYGPGEPTMEFDRMKEIVAYAREKAGDKLSVEIQTNGCFGRSVREWMLDNINIIWVSFDGEPEIQNANRPCAGGKPSAPIIEDNVRWLLDNSSDRKLMVGARVTITDINVNRQKQIVDYFRSIGITYIWTDPLFQAVDKTPACDDVEKKNAYHFDMDAYVDGFLEAYHYAETQGLFYGSFLICNFDGKCSRHCRACTPVPDFTPDGYVSACDMVTFGKDAGHMDCFVYGKWDEENHQFIFDERKIKALQNRSIEHMSHCQQCIAKDHCGGYCLGEVVNEAGHLFGQKAIACKAIKRLYGEIGEVHPPFAFLHP